jgi:hypothetical protein
MTVAQQEVSLADLETTCRVLMAVATTYDPLNFELISARRLIEVEVQERYGDDAWQRMTER